MRSRAAAAGVATCLLLAGCGTSTPAASRAVSPSASSPTSSSPATTPTPTPTRTRAPALGTVPPDWLGTRVLPVDADGVAAARRTPPELRDRRFTLPDALPMLPGSGFASRVTTPAPSAVIARSTWRQGCPVGPNDLSWIRLTFWGFDGRSHTGELLVNKSAAADLVGVFGELYRIRFPIEQMAITTRAQEDAAPTGDGNDTGAFSCRLVRGSPKNAPVVSQHAYGLAVDVNPFQNPYVKGDRVLPELATSYLDRSDRRPGMIEPDSRVVRAFARIGWTWGGTWRSLKDLQHFSANGG